MRNLLIVCVSAMLLATLAESVSAAEPAGPIAKSTLSAMGLGGMQIMSPEQGQAVRGKFTRARVSGPTYDVTRFHVAAGTNFSRSGSGFSFGASIAIAH